MILALIGQAVMVMYMYIAPGQGQTAPLGSKSFQKHKYSVNLVICREFYPLQHFSYSNACDVTHNTGVTFTFWTSYASFVLITWIRCKRNNKCYISL